jgi:hypothetical protein
MDHFSYDFRDPYYDFEGLKFAFRISTMNNTYSPDPESTNIRRSSHGLLLDASALTSAGGQLRAGGSMHVEIRKENDRFVWHGEGSHNTERIKDFGTLIKGLGITQILDEEIHDVSLAADYRRSYPKSHFPPPGGFYKSTLPVPLIFARTAGGTLYFALTKDTKLRRKTFAAYRDIWSQETVLELHHAEDARYFSTRIEMPDWHLGVTADKETAIAERMRDLEAHFGLRPFAERQDIPTWFHEVSLVLNMHCEHWTGYVFNTFDRQLEILKWVCKQIEGKHVIVFLPGWDGRYYYNYPIYKPSERCGGEAGLRRLVEGAHALGAHVIPMFGATAVGQFSIDKITELKFENVLLRDAYGHLRMQEWTDWDNDRELDNLIGWANLGNPDFRKYMFDRICYTKDMLDVDGTFLDISGVWDNDPNYSVFEGTRQIVQELHRRYRDFLMFGENWYDALLASYVLMHNEDFFYPSLLNRYCRMTHHLSHPAPGHGSTGVHEFGSRSITPEQEENPEMILTLAIVDDTLPNYERECKRSIEIAARRASGSSAG